MNAVESIKNAGIVDNRAAPDGGENKKNNTGPQKNGHILDVAGEVPAVVPAVIACEYK